MDFFRRARRVEQMHTFDQRLIDLDGIFDKIDSTKLKVCKPDPGVPAAPLLDAMKPGEPNATNPAPAPQADEEKKSS